MQMLKLLETLPEIESYYIGHGDGPGEVAKPIYTINTVMKDESEQAESNNVTAAFCHSVEIGNSDDIFKVLRIKDSLKRDCPFLRTLFTLSFVGTGNLQVATLTREAKILHKSSPLILSHMHKAIFFLVKHRKISHKIGK